MTISASKNPIIDLDTPFSSMPLELESNIHYEQFRQVRERLRQVCEQLPELPTVKSDSELPETEQRLLQVHDAQLIHGGRGSGKTNFLRTLRHILSKAGADKEDWSKLRVLEPLDPSLVASGEHFLATVVSTLLREVQREARKGSGRDQSNVSAALNDLANGLRVLRADGGVLAKGADKDEQTVARELLRGAMSGTRLHEHFHRLVIACADYLGVKAFLLLIDDADTAFSMTWEVLETLRRYLSSRRLQVVLAGDRTLFELAVLQAQYRQLRELRQWLAGGKGEHASSERQRPEDVDGHVEQLKRQYLLKLLDRTARVSLPSLGDLFFSQPGKSDPRELKVKWKGQGNSDGMLMTDLLHPLHQTFFGLPACETHLASRDVRRWPPSRLLSDNLRSAYSLLQFAADWSDGKVARDQWVEEIKEEKKKEAAQRAFERDGLERLIGVFASELGQVGLEPSLPIDLARGERYGSLGTWLLGQSIRRLGIASLDISMLEGAENIEDLRVALLVIVAALHQAARRSPGDALQALGRTWLPVNLFEYNREELEEASEVPTDAAQLAEQMSVLLRLSLAEPAWKTAARVAARQIDLKRSRDIGQLRISRKIETKHRERVAYYFARPNTGSALDKSPKRPFWQALRGARGCTFDEAADWIPTHQGMEKRFGPEVATVVNWFGLTFEQYGLRHRYLDFWKGMCALGDLLHEAAFGGGGVGADSSKDVADKALDDCLARILLAVENEAVNVLGQEEEDANKKNAQKKAGEQKAGDKASAESDDGETGAEEDGPLEEDDGKVAVSRLAGAMREWAKAWAATGVDGAGDNRRSVGLPPWVMTRVAGRLENNLKAIHELGHGRFSFGEALERWACLLLHHLLLEEASFRKVSTGRKATTPDTALKTTNLVANLNSFQANLKELAGTFGELPFFQIWASCPLLLACMKQELRQELMDGLLRQPTDQARPSLEPRRVEKAWACFPDSARQFTIRYSPRRTAIRSGPGVDMDIHTALCGLFVVPNELPNGKTADALQTLLGKPADTSPQQEGGAGEEKPAGGKKKQKQGQASPAGQESEPDSPPSDTST